MKWVNRPKRQREGRVTTSTLSPSSLHRRIISANNIGAYGGVGLGMVAILCIGLER